MAVTDHDVSPTTTVCVAHCENGPCAFHALPDDGRVRLTAHPEMRFQPCMIGVAGMERIEIGGRLQYPIGRVGERGSGQWERISWEEAIRGVARGFERARVEHGNESVAMYHYISQRGMPSGIDGHRATVYRLLSAWGGFVPMMERGNLCWHAAIRASEHLFGTWRTRLANDDECDVIVLWSANPAITGIRGPMQSLKEARRRGTYVAVVDPLPTVTARKLVDEHVQLRPGTDVALVLALTRWLIDRDAFDEALVREHTNATHLVRDSDGRMARVRRADGELDLAVIDASGAAVGRGEAPGGALLDATCVVDGETCRTVWARIRDNVEGCTPEWAEEVTGLPAASIEALARRLQEARRPKLTWYFAGGFQRTRAGEYAVTAVGTLNVLLGAYQGSVFVRGSETRFTQPSGIGDIVGRLEIENPVKVRAPLNRLAEAILSPETYGTNIRAVWVMFGNPVSQNPDSNKSIRAMHELDFLVVSDNNLSATAQYADIVLPVAMPQERHILLEGGETGQSYLHQYPGERAPRQQLFHGSPVSPPPGEAKDDFEIIRMLAHELGLGHLFPWPDAGAWIADVLGKAADDPALPWITDETIRTLDEEGIVTIDAPPYEVRYDRLPTPSGVVELYSEALLDAGLSPLPRPDHVIPPPDPRFPLQLLTPKPKRWAHSGYSTVAKLAAFDLSEIGVHPADAAARGLAGGNVAYAHNERGCMVGRVVLVPDQLPGVVSIDQGAQPAQGMANVLTSDEVSAYAECTRYSDANVELSATPPPDAARLVAPQQRHLLPAG